jgi:hypothetical protein
MTSPSTGGIRIIVVSVAVAVVAAIVHFFTSFGFEQGWIGREEVERLFIPVLGLWIVAGAGILTGLGYMVFGTADDDQA